MVEKSPSSPKERLSTILMQKHYDVMIMGSSRCVCHYDDNLMSDSLGLRTINVGEKGNGILLMYGLYHIIPINNKPQVLIYDIEPNFDYFFYEQDDHDKRYLSGLRPFFNEDGIEDIFFSVEKTEPLKMNSSFYRYNSNLFGVIRDYFSTDVMKYSSYKPTNTHYVNNEGTSKERDVDPIKLHYFEQLINDTKKDNVKLIVVASPKYGVSDKKGIQPLKELCERNDVPFWDYYLDMHDTRWFCDNNHLNLQGSKVFTNTIVNRIRKEINLNIQ